SYEAAYVNGLWHWDCHHGSRKVLTARGEWQTPILFGVLDDRSRLACHLQWYLAESAETIAHGLSQGLCHVAVPRARSVGTSGIVRPLRLQSATWSSRHREARGAFGRR